MAKLTVVRDYSADLERDIFVSTGNTEKSSIETALKSSIKSAREKICAVFEHGLNDDMALVLAGATARKYIIVPEILETKYNSISGKAIVREVPEIKGNYIIIDDTELFFFDEKYNGAFINKVEALIAISQIFLKEFWENAKFEYIEKRLPAAEATFDIPPVYGNKSVLIDESVELQTAVEKLIKDMPTMGFVDKVAGQSQAKNLVIKSPSVNRDFLRTTTNENILYAPGLPFSFVTDGKKVFLLNFDTAKYETLLERGKGHLFAVECDTLDFGKTYKFTKHIARSNLVGKDVVDVDGRQIVFSASETIVKTIDVDLKMAQEYLKMPPETLADRLSKVDATLLVTDKLTTRATFHIELRISKHKGNNRQAIYEIYEKLNKEISDKYIELINAAQVSGQDKHAFKVMVNPDRKGDFTTIAGYKKDVEDLNNYIAEYMLGAKKSDIDEGLSDVKGSSKKRFVEVKPLTIKLPTADLPKYGILYTTGDGRAEYVIESESYLQKAIAELAIILGNGAQNATYHLE